MAGHPCGASRALRWLRTLAQAAKLPSACEVVTPAADAMRLVERSYDRVVEHQGAGPSWASSVGVRRSMKSNRRRDTRPELAIRKQLFAQGVRYRVDYPLSFDKRRRADIVFPRQRIAVFIDGCFWHGCTEHYAAPRTNMEFWSRKVAGNRSRDQDTNERLAEAGWLVLRFWEHEAPGVIVETVLAARACRSESRRSPSAIHRSRAGRRGSPS